MLKGGERMIQYPNTADLMIRNITVYTQDAGRTVLPSVDVAIRGDTIAAIGHLPKKEWTAKQELDGTGKTLFPGMHNMHVHVFQSLLKDLGADKDLVGWLQDCPFRCGPHITPEMFELACKLAAMESLRSGVTTLADFCYLQSTIDFGYISGLTMEKIGIRGIFMDCFHSCGEDMNTHPSMILPPKEAIARTHELKTFFEDGTHPLNTVWPGISVSWGGSPELYDAVVDYSEKTGTPYTMHVLETEDDNVWTQKHFGKDLVEVMEEHRFLSDKLLAVHDVVIKPHEIETFARCGVNVVYCPMANTILGSGIPPMTEMMRRGINITMATDGAGSNNSSDMVESLKMGLLLQKGYMKDPTAMTAQNMLDFITVNAARAEHRTDIGSLEVGKKADMFIYDPTFLRSAPNFNTLATLMYNSSQENIETTIVGGRIAYHKGQFACGLDEREVAREAIEYMNDWIKTH